ncbi:MAG: hypothetical protein FWG83_00845 [Oscillospiraceae bacterium]|nr:hypothetical protein [Oscillospiraceae bacterium]
MVKISEKYSLDDILNEYPRATSPKPEKSGNVPFSDDAESLTAEIASIEKRRGLDFEPSKSGEKSTEVTVKSTRTKTAEFSVTQILNEASGKAGKSSKTSKSDSDLSVTQILNESKGINAGTENFPETSETPDKPVELQRFSAPKKPTGKFRKSAAVAAKAEARNQAEVKASLEKTFEEIVSGDKFPIEKPGRPTYLVPESVKSTKKSDSDGLNEGLGEQYEKESFIKEARLLSEDEQLSREEELLEKEMALEDPFELIDGINPYDVRNTAALPVQELVQALNEKEEAENSDKNGQTKESEIAAVSGDTKESDVSKTSKGSAASHDSQDSEEGVEESVKEFKIKSDKSNKNNSVFSGFPSNASKKRKKDFTEIPDFKPPSDNSALKESITDKLKRKRQSDIDARRTLTVDTLSSVVPGKGKPLPAKLNIDYKKQIIQDSSLLPTSDLQLKQMEEREMAKKKKRKIRDFILEDIEDDDDDFYYEEEQADEYDGYDSSGQIWADLKESHKGLRWRFAILFLLTAGTVFLAFVHDLGKGNAGLRYEITTALFGADNLSSYASAMVYANLIAGVAGICICSGVVLRGFKNLFFGKADCDSACAIPIVLTTVATIAQITEKGSTNFVEQNNAHVYVSVALAGLLFNTLGKMLMIVRAKKNFGFISGDSVKYSAFMPNTNEDVEARGFTKNILDSPPAPVFLRKTEFLTDYLKNSYCVDWADLICRKLVPLSVILTIVMGIASFFLPFGNQQLRGDIRWAATVMGVFSTVLAPFSVMFLVNNPLLKAAKSLSKSEAVVMGYTAAHKYSQANAVVVDANLLFPAGSVKFLNVKRCQKPNAINTVQIEEYMVVAASLAIKGNSIMSSMFNDIINNDSDVLCKIENCIYEVNMGLMGWMGSKRVMLGNRDQMKHHGVSIPDEATESKHCPENGDVVYLAIGSEAVAMFFIEVIANPAVRNAVRELVANDVALAVKSKDSLVTAAKINEVFGLEVEPDITRVRVLPFDQHNSFDDYSRYTSRGNSEIACNGTFTSFAKALITAKTLIRDMMVTSALMFVSVFVGGMLGIVFTAATATGLMSASVVTVYHLVWLVIILILQGLRRY